MPKVLIVSQHAEIYRNHLQQASLPDFDVTYCLDAEQAGTYCAAAEIIFGAPDRIAPLLEHCHALRWVQSSWAGVRPFSDAQRRDYLLTGVKEIFGAPMSEYVLGWLLALERNILERSRATDWDERAERGVEGKLAGIMGTGSIGSHVAHSLRHFGVRTRGFNSSGNSTPEFDSCFGPDALDAFADGLDYLVAILPDTEDTTNLIDAHLLARLRTGAIVINGGRGNCLVESDLVSAMKSGQVAHAVIDVMREEPPPASHPFWAEENIYLTSHTAAPTRASSIVRVFCENYARYISGEALHYTVNLERGY